MNMQKYLKPQVAAIQPSVIRKFFDLAAKMEGVVSLGIGEPDFSTPLPFCEAGWRSMQQGKTGYSPNPGLLELRQAISRPLCLMRRVWSCAARWRCRCRPARRMASS